MSPWFVWCQWAASCTGMQFHKGPIFIFLSQRDQLKVKFSNQFFSKIRDGPKILLFGGVTVVINRGTGLFIHKVADKAKLNLKGEMINTWCIHDEFDLNDYRLGWVELGCLKSLKKENTIPWKINNLTRETKGLSQQNLDFTGKHSMNYTKLGVAQQGLGFRFNRPIMFMLGIKNGRS